MWSFIMKSLAATILPKNMYVEKLIKTNFYAGETNKCLPR